MYIHPTNQIYGLQTSIDLFSTPASCTGSQEHEFILVPMGHSAHSVPSADLSTNHLCEKTVHPIASGRTPLDNIRTMCTNKLRIWNQTKT